MRSFLPLLLALACPIGMCLVPMLLMRRRGRQAGSSATVTVDPTEAVRPEGVGRLHAARERDGDALRRSDPLDNADR